MTLMGLHKFDAPVAVLLPPAPLPSTLPLLQTPQRGE
jgi:hypothetical protein